MNDYRLMNIHFDKYLDLHIMSVHLNVPMNIQKDFNLFHLNVHKNVHMNGHIICL